MLTISAADEALITAPGGARRQFLRVDVKDSGGTWRDLTTYALDQNLVLGATWGEDVDSPAMSGTVRLKREAEYLSLAPLMDTSALNLGFDPSGTPAALIAPGREIKLFVAVMPEGVLPSSGDWKERFHGRIDKAGWAGEVMELAVSDKLQGDCRDAFIERERVYAHADPTDPDATKGLFIYEPGRVYAVGELVMPTELKRNGHFYAVSAITTGTAGAEGTWPLTSGGTATFGGITVQEKGTTSTTTGTSVETVLQQIATDNGTGVTVTTPSSPGWLIKWYLQQRVSTWAGMMQLVDQIGWDLRPRWDSGTSSFKLKFTEVDRAKTTPDRTFAAADVLDVKRLDIDRADIRNVVRVVYSDSGILDLQGDPVRVTVERSNSASITAFGRRFMEIAEASSSQIDSIAEAEAMADAALSDLCAPVAEKEVDLEYFPYVELGDLYRFSGDGLRHSGDLDLAVTGYQHTVSETEAITVLKCRGKPSGGVERWLSKAAEINPDDTHQLVLANSGDVLTLASGTIIGGAKLLAKQTMGKKALQKTFHFHVSETSSFTPSTGTLVSGGATDAMHFGQGYSGQTYYAKLFAAGWNAQRKVIAEASEETSFVAGYLEPHHVHPEKFRMELPPNGSFEGQFRSAGPPDRWEMVTGTWATDLDAGAAKGVGAADGARYLLFKATSVATSVRSDYFPVARTHVYELLAQVYRVSGDGDWALEVEWYTGAKASISTSTLTVDTGVLTSSAWNLVRAVFSAPSTAAFGRFVIRKTTTHSDLSYFDACKLTDLGEPWLDVGSGGGSFSNSWAASKGGVAPGMRPEHGRVWLKGSMAGGTVGSVAITAPSQLFPVRTVRCPVVDGAGALREVEINTSGQLTLLAGNNTIVYLDHVSWPLS